MVQGLGNNISFNSISDYNKIFEENMKGFNQDFGQNSLGEFENILNQQTQNLQAREVSAPITGGIGMDVAKLDFQINNPSGIEKTQPAASSEQLTQNFVKGISNSLNKLNNQQLEAERAVETLAAGGDISVHDVMIASEKASLSMQMGLQLRNKILTTYNELYNIRI